jgi:hypothetical protein
VFLATALAAQSPKPYFQQQVNYTINATLDDEKHTLAGDIVLEYVNNSPDALPQIWMHLWPNAYKNRRTAFCKQKLRDADMRFYFTDEKNLGGLKNLDFSADGQKIAWKYDPQNPDIAVLNLPKPLPPGGSVRLSTPFLLKIPASFSRLGHVGKTYQMTQWYPKPAVYDHKGWHAMPYLDIGEFYSEFGDFDVTLTLPGDYVVGATGVLQTASEIDFLNQKRAITQELFKTPLNKESEARLPRMDTLPYRRTDIKTIRYRAENVHDFAWFADKNFFVLKEEASLASGKKVDCWAMFTRQEAKFWQKGAFYVRRAVEFYSQHVGEYPWPHATAVQSALSAGGGMEYPMITVIGYSGGAKELDEVITHEVGHNWFYGILASNERDHPFLDEGLNSYYEFRYMRQHYGPVDFVSLPKWLHQRDKHGTVIEIGQLLLAREDKDTPPDTHSNDMANLTYGLQTYTKPANTLHWLEQSVGTERFDRAMQDYYRTWQFRHPYPEDLRASWAASGLRADWWFELMQTQKKVDVALRKADRQPDGSWALSVRQRGGIKAPYPVAALQAGKTVATQWVQPGEMPRFAPVDADEFVIDPEHVMLDVNRRNNQRRSSGAFPGLEPLQIRALAALQEPKRSTLGLLPWLGWNNYDKTMLGAVLFNPPLPVRRFQYYLAPGYGLGSGQFVGLADLRYKWLFPGGPFAKVTLGASAKTFHFDYNPGADYRSRMYRVVPQLRVEFRDRSIPFRHFLNLRAILLGTEQGQFDATGFLGKAYTRSNIFEARYEAIQKRAPNPWALRATLEQSSDFRSIFGEKAPYLRGSVEWRQRFFYQPNRRVSARFFAGYFFQNDRRRRAVEPNAFSLNPQGFNDYRFDQVFLARSSDAGLLARQVGQNEGGFKGAFGAPFAGVLGNSNNYLLALNLKADLPQRLPLGIPLRPYFDLGYFDDATPLGQDRPRNEQLLWSGGFLLEFFKGSLEVYFPVASAKPLRDLYKEQGNGNYLRNISWSVRVPFREPGELLEHIIR